MKIFRIAQNITVYRGEGSYNKGGNYFTTDREWARQFTQSGRDFEIQSFLIPSEAIYTAFELPKAYDEASFDKGIFEAQENGFSSFWVDEGSGQPNSIYVIDKGILIEVQNNEDL